MPAATPDAARTLDVSGRSVRHGELLATGDVLALHAAGAVWDTAQGWFVNRTVAFRPESVDHYKVIDLARVG